MSAKAANGIGALLMWGIVALMFVSIFVGAFVVPGMVAGWRAQGLKEVPAGWQVLVDAGDFSMHRGWMVIPVLAVIAIVLTVRSIKADPGT